MMTLNPQAEMVYLRSGNAYVDYTNRVLHLITVDSEFNEVINSVPFDQVNSSIFFDLSEEDYNLLYAACWDLPLGEKSGL
jgi:hypothetical protein